MSFDFLFADYVDNNDDLLSFNAVVPTTTVATEFDAEWFSTSSAAHGGDGGGHGGGDGHGGDDGGGQASPRNTNISSRSSSASGLTLTDALPELHLSADMQAVHDTATQKLRTLQKAATACRFALCDEFLPSLRNGTYTHETKVFVCLTHARASFSKACTYALTSVHKARSHAKAAAEATSTADGSHAKKRHRAAKACEACRIGKRRCERERGAASCTHCSARGLACEWSGGDDDDDDEGYGDAVAADEAVRTTSVALPLDRATPAVLSEALLEEMGHSDDVASYVSFKMPPGAPQLLLLPPRSLIAILRRNHMSGGPTIVNMNDEFCALTGMARSELQFSPVEVVLAPQSASAIIEMLAMMRRIMTVPLDRHVVKARMQMAVSINGVWFPAELTSTMVFRNRLPSLAHICIDRVLVEQPLPVQELSLASLAVSPVLNEELLRHKEFVANLLRANLKV